MTRTRTTLLLTIATVGVVAGGAVVVRVDSDDDPERLDPKTGEMNVELEPDRVRIGTDLFGDIGYGWLDGANFRDVTNPGPFLVWEREDSDEASYWYYKGHGIVPISTPLDELRPLDTVAIPVQEGDAQRSDPGT
jgi:hypothetical protein